MKACFSTGRMHALQKIPLVLYWSNHPGTRQRTICGLEDRARSVIFKLEDKVLASAEGFYAMSQHAPLMNQLRQDTGSMRALCMPCRKPA